MVLFALAIAVSAQSNMNCDVWPTSGSPPAPDYVALFRFIGNDSHVQMTSMSDYPYTVGCNSTIAALDYGCTGTAINILQLFRNNDSHVSVDNYYPNQLCFNTSTPSRSFYMDISAPPTPAGYECIFAIAKINDSHVYECDNANATYNVNIKINSTAPPYSGCVDLDNESTFQGKVINNSDGYWFIQSASLCRKTYYKNDTGADGVIIMNATGISLNCNDSVIVGNSAGYGFVSSDFNSTSLTRCTAAGYAYGIYESYSTFPTMKGLYASVTDCVAANNTQYGFHLRMYGGLGRNLTAYNSTKGVYLDSYNMLQTNLLHLKLHNNTDGLHVYSSGTANVSHVESSNNTGHGILLEQYLYENTFYNISSHDNAGSGIYYDGPRDGGQLSNITLARIYNNGGYGIYAKETIQPFIYRDVEIYSNSGDGFYTYYNPGDTLDNVTIRDNGGHGVFIDGRFNDPANALKVNNSRIYRNGGDGIIMIDRSALHTFENTMIYNNTGRGIFALGYNFSADYAVYGLSMKNVTVANQTYNLYFNNTFDSVIRNCSFSDSAYNVYLVNATNNMFYYNSFIGSSALHAYSDRSGSFFNTTNGSDCGPNCSRGNYWDDILTLDILDLNGDGFGDTGTEYPYNSTYSSKVNVNVTDYGPITTKGCVDADGDGFYPYSASPACPGTYRDCDDTNASILPPYEDMLITADTILCNGTYQLDDSVGENGSIIIGTDGVTLRCNSTLILGEGPWGSSDGKTFNISGHDNVVIRDCNVSSYPFALWNYRQQAQTDNFTFCNISINYTYDGVYMYNVTNSNFTDIRFTNIEYWAMGLQNLVANNTFRDISINHSGQWMPGGGLTYGGDGSNNLFDGWSCWNVYGICMELYGYSDIGPNNVSGLYAYNVSGNGIGLYISEDGNTVSDSEVELDEQACFWMQGANITMKGIRATDCGTDGNVDGIYVASSANFNISGAVVSNSTRHGVFVTGSDNGTYHDVNVSDCVAGINLSSGSEYANVSGCRLFNNAVGLGFLNGDSNIAHNNTLEDNDYGVYLDSGSTGNLFYFNSFLSSTYAHAYAAAAGNFFNTTNGSDCGANCSRGNYWDDIMSLGIYDSNADGFGDQGPDYPYNAANGGNVSADVQDEGPITNKPVPVSAEATMVIYGPNGTDITGTRNVHLNISFGTGIACRWANDNESNLTGMPWENCTTVKPWILSEPEGNKTVYMEVKAPGGATSIVNDSIMYRFMQDYTPPTSPVVYDSDYGYDIDWWNDNTTVSAYWWNATDDISTTYYKYRLLNDSDCYVAGCPWTDVGPDTDLTVTGLSLQEGWNVSFEVLAYTASGLNASVVSSNGSWIDLTRPAVPVINSSTHPLQHVTYDNGTVILNFTATDPVGGGVSSGVEGYSYVLDRHPGTAPDSNMEGRFWFTLEGMVNDGFEQLLRANSTSPSPDTYAIYSQLHGNFTAGENVRVRVAMAERGSDFDDEMRVKVFLLSAADGAGVGSFTFNMEGDAITTISNVSRDVRYSELMTGAVMYEFNVQVTSTTNDNTDDIYVVVTGVPGDDDNRNNLSLAGSTSHIDNSTNLFICNNTPDCGDYTYALDLAVEVKKEDTGSVWDVQYDGLQDGDYYFHVKAKDRAGNWGDTGHYNISIDTAGVAVDIISPFTGQLFTTENVTVAVEVNEQANVTVYAMHPDGSNDTSDWKVFTGRDVFNLTMENGTNRLYAMAINPENNVVTYSRDVYVLFGTDLPTGPKTLRVVYPGVSCAGHICESTEAGATVGMATENDTWAYSSDDMASDTARHTIKIFATNPAGVGSKVESEMGDDDFLDRVQPLFGYERGVPYYIIRTETRPVNVYLDGEQRLGSGRYTLVFRNVGTTAEGKANITVRIA